MDLMPPLPTQREGLPWVAACLGKRSIPCSRPDSQPLNPAWMGLPHWAVWAHPTGKPPPPPEGLSACPSTSCRGSPSSGPWPPGPLASTAWGVKGSSSSSLLMGRERPRGSPQTGRAPPSTEPHFRVFHPQAAPRVRNLPGDHRPSQSEQGSGKHLEALLSLSPPHIPHSGPAGRERQAGSKVSSWQRDPLPTIRPSCPPEMAQPASCCFPSCRNSSTAPQVSPEGEAAALS